MSTRSPACDADLGEVRRIDEHDAALAVDAAIAVVEAVDRGVILVVRTEGLQHEQPLLAARPLVLRLIGQRDRSKNVALRDGVCQTRCSTRVVQTEAARLAHALVVIVEAGNGARRCRSRMRS